VGIFISKLEKIYRQYLLRTTAVLLKTLNPFALYNSLQSGKDCNKNSFKETSTPLKVVIPFKAGKTATKIIQMRDK